MLERRFFSLQSNAATRPHHIGGKAWSLVQLSKAGLPVPNGFVMTAHAFAEYIEFNELKEDPTGRASSHSFA
ncbi:MAG: hypothetical protein IPL77_07165 [Flavobacteriales bacterium]|nr:hypothetical protein [Flavobacteriales bacterium]